MPHNSKCKVPGCWRSVHEAGWCFPHSVTEPVRKRESDRRQNRRGLSKYDTQPITGEK